MTPSDRRNAIVLAVWIAVLMVAGFGPLAAMAVVGIMRCRGLC